MKCPNCGKEIANDSVFCEFCGAKVEVAKQSQVSYNGQEHPMMSFGGAIKTCFSKYATFSGRATRAEYWWFWLFTFCLGLIGGALSMGILSILCTIAFLLPSLAVGVRRCHDTNHSGWWLLCPIYNLVLMFYASDPGANDYGVLDA
jgi:hypothetical protein